MRNGQASCYIIRKHNPTNQWQGAFPSTSSATNSDEKYMGLDCTENMACDSNINCEGRGGGVVLEGEINI